MTDQEKVDRALSLAERAEAAMREMLSLQKMMTQCFGMLELRIVLLERMTFGTNDPNAIRQALDTLRRPI